MNFSSFSDFLFLSLLAAPASAVFLYPWALRAMAAWAKPLSVPRQAATLPPVTVVVSAYNEDTVIEARIRNLLALDYPRELLRILVASDGSTDRTNDIVRSFAGEGVQLVLSVRNQGKSAALRAAVEESTTELLVVTDANTAFHPQALRRLVRWFDNSAFGIVCGALTFTDVTDNPAAREEHRYWSWINGMKRLEGRLGIMEGGNGSILALRRQFAVEIPSTVPNDAIWIQLARLRGVAVGYEPDAVAYETTAGSTLAEYRRRVRIINRGWNSMALMLVRMARMAPADRASTGSLAFFLGQLLLKKVSRYLAFPALLLALLLVPVLGNPMLQALGVALWAVGGAAVAVGLASPWGRRLTPRWPNPIYALALAWASVVALGRFVLGRKFATWQPERSPFPMPVSSSSSQVRVLQ